MPESPRRYDHAAEPDLVRWAQAGDAEAFGSLVEAYKERVYMLALQMTHNHSEADELSQQAFVRAYQSIGKFREQSNFFTWLYRITTNVCLTHLQGRKRWTPLPDPNSEEDQPSAPEIGSEDHFGQATEEDQARRQVWAALDQLGPEIRAAAVLVYLQDFSPREAAKTLDCAEATIHWRLFKARNQLKRLLADGNPER
jgi:RNA polymerase sigma-70 factor, ECF subfamily